MVACTSLCLSTMNVIILLMCNLSQILIISLFSIVTKFSSEICCHFLNAPPWSNKKFVSNCLQESGFSYLFQISTVIQDAEIY